MNVYIVKSTGEYSGYIAGFAAETEQEVRDYLIDLDAVNGSGYIYDPDHGTCFLAVDSVIKCSHELEAIPGPFRLLFCGGYAE